MRRQGPKVQTFYLLARIGPNLFCRLSASLRVICESQIGKKKCREFRQSQVTGSVYAGRDPKCENFTGFLESAQTCSADLQQTCESFASVRAAKKRVWNFVNPRLEEAHAQAGTQSANILLACYNRPKLVLQPSSKPASHARVRSEKRKCREFRQPKVRGSACAARALKCKTFTGLLESAQTFSADSQQACESFACFRSAKQNCREFREPQAGRSACESRSAKCQDFTGLLESA